MNNLEIISVVNDFDCYERTIKSNQFMNKYNLHIFDNSKENLGIAARYNFFIKNQILTNKIKDSWLVFCHQDFGFLQDPLEILTKQNKNCIYGPTGAAKKKPSLGFNWKRKFPFYFYVKYRVKRLGKIKQGFHSKKYFTLNEEYNKSNIGGQFFYKGNELFKIGDELFYYVHTHNFLNQPSAVDTLDCCCIIIHSSLLTKYNLLFDEKFTFHLYGEDFSLAAKYNHNITTKALQFDCFHRGEGNMNNLFKSDLEFMKQKYSGRKFVGTCFRCDW